MLGPLLPWLSDSQDCLDAMFQRAADLQVEVIWVDALNPRPRVWPAVSQLLRDRFPDLLERYQQMLFDSGARSRYLSELGQRVQRAGCRCRGASSDASETARRSGPRRNGLSLLAHGSTVAGRLVPHAQGRQRQRYTRMLNLPTRDSNNTPPSRSRGRTRNQSDGYGPNMVHYCQFGTTSRQQPNKGILT